MPSSRFRRPRDPQRFPVLFADAVEAAARSGEEVLLLTAPSESAAKAKAEIFRDWRFCLRNWPQKTRCHEIETTARIATRIEPIAGVYGVYVTVRSDHYRSMLALNPDILQIAIDNGIVSA